METVGTQEDPTEAAKTKLRLGPNARVSVRSGDFVWGSGRACWQLSGVCFFLSLAECDEEMKPLGNLMCPGGVSLFLSLAGATRTWNHWRTWVLRRVSFLFGLAEGNQEMKPRGNRGYPGGPH